MGRTSKQGSDIYYGSYTVWHFRDKEKAYRRAKIEELETNGKIQNIRYLYRGINDFKNGYQPRCNLVKDEKSELVVDSHSIVARWRNYFSQLFNMHGVKDVRQAEIRTAEPLVPEPSAAEVEVAIDKPQIAMYWSNTGRTD